MMKKTLFTGSCVALVTPFTSTGVDFDKLEELIEWHIKEGTDANPDLWNNRRSIHNAG